MYAGAVAAYIGVKGQRVNGWGSRRRSRSVPLDAVANPTDDQRAVCVLQTRRMKRFERPGCETVNTVEAVAVE